MTVTVSATDLRSVDERLGLRARAVERMLDAIVDAAQLWPERYGDIGFDDRQTERLAVMLRNRIAGLR